MNRALTYLDKSKIPLATIHDIEENSWIVKKCLCADEVFDELWSDPSRFDTVIFDNDDFDREELYNAARNHPFITFILNNICFEHKFEHCENIIYFDAFTDWLGSV